MELSGLRKKSFKTISDLENYFRYSFKFPKSWSENRDWQQEFLVRIATDVLRYEFARNAKGEFLQVKVYWSALYLFTADFSSLDDFPDSIERAGEAAISQAGDFLYKCEGQNWWVDGSEFIDRMPERFKIITME